MEAPESARGPCRRARQCPGAPELAADPSAALSAKDLCVPRRQRRLQRSEMSCEPHRGSRPFSSISSSSAAHRPRPQAHRIFPAHPGLQRRAGTAHRRPRGSCCGALQPGYLLEGRAVPGRPGAAPQLQFHLRHVHTRRVGCRGPSAARAGAVAWQQATPQGGAGGAAPLPSRSPGGFLGKRAELPPPAESARLWKPSPRRGDGVKKERKVKKQN